MSATIRIAHFADTHLGYRSTSKLHPGSSRNQRTVDVDDAFTSTIDDILKNKVDAVIHSGDVFHHARPTWQSLRHFIRQMRRLEHAGIPTLVIAGNHDTPRIRTGGSAYSVLELALPETRFACDYEDIHDDTTFSHLGLHVHAIPHGALTNPDHVWPSAVIGQLNVLVTHGVTPDILPSGLQMEPGEQNLHPAMLDAAFDYIALGHIHQAQQVADNAWYAGSTERFGWGDTTATPGYNLVQLSSPGTSPTVTHIDIPTRQLIFLQPVYGEGKQARQVADAVIDQLEALGSPNAMARVDFRNVDRPTRHEAQSLLKREAERHVWHLDVAPERQLFMIDAGSPVADDPALDLHALFTEFVTSRKPTYPNEAFATMLLERGGRALTDALVAEESVMPEDDAVS